MRGQSVEHTFVLLGWYNVTLALVVGDDDDDDGAAASAADAAVASAALAAAETTALSFSYSYGLASDLLVTSTAPDGGGADAKTAAPPPPSGGSGATTAVATSTTVTTSTLAASHVARVVCKYVRREVRTLSDDDRGMLIGAMKTLYNTTTDAGRDQYGDAYRGVEWFARAHLHGAAARDCDHWHDGAGIVTHHVAFTLLFEQALQVARRPARGCVVVGVLCL